MAHFALLNENNVVTMVVVVSNDDMTDDNGNESEALGVAVCESTVAPGRWVQTSYNRNFRGVMASIGGTYDDSADVFISPSPYESWVLNGDYEWEAPIPKPADENRYIWNEEALTWQVFPYEDPSV